MEHEHRWTTSLARSYPKGEQGFVFLREFCECGAQRDIPAEYALGGWQEAERPKVGSMLDRACRTVESARLKELLQRQSPSLDVAMKDARDILKVLREKVVPWLRGSAFDNAYGPTCAEDAEDQLRALGELQ